MGRKRGWSGGQRRDWKRKWEDRKAVFLPTPASPIKPPVVDQELHPPTARYFRMWNKWNGMWNNHFQLFSRHFSNGIPHWGTSLP